MSDAQALLRSIAALGFGSLDDDELELVDCVIDELRAAIRKRRRCFDASDLASRSRTLGISATTSGVAETSSVYPASCMCDLIGDGRRDLGTAVGPMFSAAFPSAAETGFGSDPVFPAGTTPDAPRSGRPDLGSPMEPKSNAPTLADLGISSDPRDVIGDGITVRAHLGRRDPRRRQRVGVRASLRRGIRALSGIRPIRASRHTLESTMTAPLQPPKHNARIAKEIDAALERARDLIREAQREVRRAMRLDAQLMEGRR